MVAIDHVAISGYCSHLCIGMFILIPYESSLHQSEPSNSAETRMKDSDLFIFSYCGLHQKG
jgi:hypothetical protein